MFFLTWNRHEQCLVNQSIFSFISFVVFFLLWDGDLSWLDPRLMHVLSSSQIWSLAHDGVLPCSSAWWFPGFVGAVDFKSSWKWAFLPLTATYWCRKCLIRSPRSGDSLLLLTLLDLKSPWYGSCHDTWPWQLSFIQSLLESSLVITAHVFTAYPRNLS
jgi:hypothetical protein